jgi:hypothetical protein
MASMSPLALSIVLLSALLHAGWTLVADCDTGLRLAGAAVIAVGVALLASA